MRRREAERREPDRFVHIRHRAVIFDVHRLGRLANRAKAAVGDRPVFDYIAGLPEPQRGIAEAVDLLAAATLSALERSVKWGMAYYGVGDGWCFSSGAFVGHVKLMFINGATAA